ncbi:TPA_exp: Uncharacterized protein A8136_4131 [Trichophyton benhamiae CBS 112371]|nr:TPA_exp: Uncharacterized protein A8136_4131 [Trichophyton benhamiae CBS 112371]
MPGLQLPRAAFEPISPDLDFTELVESTPNFEPVTRIPAHAIEEQGIENFEKLVKLHVIYSGKPLVVEGYGIEIARDLTNKSNVPLTIQHYLSSMAGLTDQFNATNYKDSSRQRMYLKDIDCPPVWHEKLRSLLPQFLYYMNESVTGKEGDATPAGDLMSSLPEEMRAMNMMCYIGHEGTYTPAHREMCATLGHNIMVEASTGGLEDGKPTKPGSSIWFMTEKKDLKVVSEYWLSTLGHDIEIEDHFAQINAWKSAPFKTWVVEQKVGDFILIPPLAPHQVWNRGTRTMKVAWNRTTAETLDLALTEALPRARMVCRDEQYKNKAIIYFSLKKYSSLLEKSTPRDDLRYRSLKSDFKRLFALFTQILLSESFSTRIPEPKNVEFLTCPSCIGKFPDGEDDTYDVCMDCFVMGRSCACISKLRWVEQFRWKDLTRDHERWRNQIAKFSSGRSRKDKDNFQPLSVEQEKYEKKTLAEICQVELKRRPWTDITKPVKEDVDDDDENHRESTRKRRKITKADKHKYSRCHICGPTLNWKLETCSQCNLQWCYGSLYRAFDIMPMTVLERRDPTIEGYVPTETRIGHDTKKIADVRSVESLVDFSHSNLFWLKKSGEHPETSQNSRRMQLRIEEAEKAKLDEPVLYNHDSDGSEIRGAEEQNNNSNFDESLIDPALMDRGHQTSFVVPQNAIFRDDVADRYQPTEGITFEYPEPEQPAEQNKVEEIVVDPNLFQTNGQALEEVNGGEPDEDEPEDLPVDPNLDDGASGRRKRGIEIDDDFTLSRRSISRINTSGSRKVATRRSQLNPIQSDDLGGSGSDQSEGEEGAEEQTSQAMLRPRTSRPAKKTVKKSVATKASKSKTPKKASEVDETKETGESIPTAESQNKSPLEPRSEVNGTAKQAAKNKTAKLQAMGWVEDDDSDGWT